MPTSARRPILVAAVVALATAAPAAAQDSPPSDPDGPACRPGTTAKRGLAALRVVIERGPLPARAGAAVPVLVLPCERGRLTLEVRLRGSSVVIARGVRELRPGRPHRVMLRTTRAGQRRAGRRLRLRARAAFVARA